MHARSDHCAIVARHGHGDQADGDGARLGCWGGFVSIDKWGRAIGIAGGEGRSSVSN